MDTPISKQDQKLSKKLPTEVPNEIIEEQTKKIPNLMFMGLAGLSLIGSAFLSLRPGSPQKKSLGSFVGLWVPTLLILGLYNKLVKVEEEILEKSVVH